MAGSEWRAFAHSKQLFESVTVRVIFMDWTSMREKLAQEVESAEISQMVANLRELGFEPRSDYNSESTLSDGEMKEWPDNIVWKEADAFYRNYMNL